MTAIIILIALLAVGPLALRYGVDSRSNDVRERPRHWPAG
jgi:hypothetical protein